MKKIVTINDADHLVLRHKAQAVTFPLSEEVKQVIDDLKQSIAKLENAVGLAAPQIGHAWQVALLQIPAAAAKLRKWVEDIVPLTVMINPIFTPDIQAGQIKDWEGCFSVPDKMGEVRRFHAIDYQYFAEDGKKIQGRARGLLARVIQHEVGHLRGQLFFDLLTQDCRFGSVTELLPIRLKELQAWQSSNP